MASPGTTPASLRKLLLDLAQQDAGLADRAEVELQAATDRYFASKPYADSTGARSRPGISEDRAAVRKVGRKAHDLRQAVEALSAHGRQALSTALEGPLGSATIGLEALLTAIPAALQSLRAEPDKPGDYHLNVWAYEIAIVLRDTLHIAPSATRDDATTQHTRGGAAYARLLQEARLLISSRGIDIGRLIDAGLELLKDPTGDGVK